MQDRIGVIVNVHSLYHAANKCLSSSISYKALMDDITKDRRLISGVACVIGAGGRQQGKFLGSLRYAGLQPVLRPNEELLRDQFVFEMIKLAPLVDVLVLCTADQSILPILDYLSETDRLPKVELWSLADTTPDEMLEEVDVIHHITEDHIYVAVGAKKDD